MTTLLKVIGTIIIVFSIIGGIASGSLWKFVMLIVSGLSGAIVYFVLAGVLETQDDIIKALQEHEHVEKSKV
jgi:hypothetical protein